MAYKFPSKIFPNSLNCYLQCPFKFKCHNDKDLKPEFVENPQSFVGKVIHSVLNDLFDIAKVPADKRNEQDLGEMIRHYWARLEKNGFSKDCWTTEERAELFGSREQEKAYGLQTIAILNNYIAKADLSAIPLFLEDWMDCEIGEFQIAGRIDRIDQGPDNSAVVWDYKTGKLPFHGSLEKMIKEDLQVPIYAVIVAKRLPSAEKIKAGLIYIKYSKVFDIVWTREQIKELEERIIKEIKKAQADEELPPRINKLCPWCEYRELCPEKSKIEGSDKKVEEVNW